MDSARRLAYWINEREKIRIKKERGDEPPWTDDQIMATTRWCNVHREDDKVTQWLRKHYLNPAQARGGDLETYFVSAVGRYVNWPDTLQHIKLHPWSIRQFLQVVSDRENEGKQVFGGAYIISTNGQRMEKGTFVAQLLDRFRRFLPELQELDTLDDAYRALTRFDGIGSFMAGQIIADCKNTPDHRLKLATDWWSWCCRGPGSTKGLNYYFGNDPDAPIGDAQFRRLINRVAKEVIQYTDISMHMQDLQNCLCEFSKYERIRHGGRAKNRYHARANLYT